MHKRKKARSLAASLTMASKQQVKWSLLIVNVGYKIKCLPYYWNKHLTKPRLLKTESEVGRIIWFLASLINIYVRVGLITFGIIFDEIHYKNIVHISQRIQYYFVITVWTLSLLLQLNSLIFSERARIVFDAGLYFIHKLRKIHKVDPAEDKIITHCAQALYLAAACVTVSVIPVTFTVVYEFLGLEFIERSWVMLRLLGLLMCFGASVVVSFGVFTDWIFVIHYCSVALVYCSAICKCVSLSRWQPNMSRRRKVILRRFYLAHQILHNLVVKESKMLVGAILAAAQAIVIVGLTSLIAFGKEFPIAVSITIGATCLIAVLIVNMCLDYSAEMTEITVNFPLSYLRNDKTLTKYERKVYKSFNKLSIQAGIIVISRKTSLHVWSEVILTAIMNTLLAFRSRR